jgi:outer membrane protein W
MKMRAIQGAFLALFFVIGPEAMAGIFEIGAGYSYRHSSYNNGSYTSTSTYNASFGYFFTQDSEVEFLYSDSSNIDFVTGVQDIHYRDRVYSLNLVYHLLSESSSVRPFVRAGVGQLNRDATGTYAGGFSPPGRLDQVTVIGGLGFKARISSQFGLKAEATSYLTGGSVSTWKDNIAVSVGGSFYF